MTPKRAISPFLIFLFLFLISCDSNNNDKNDEASKAKAADFNHFEIENLDGNTLNSASLAGKVFVIDFWATWCKPCIQEIPAYNRLYEKYKDENFQFLGVTMDSGNADAIKPYIDEFEINYPIYVGNNDIRIAFGELKGYPSTFVVDQNGKIQKSYLGISQNKAEELDAIVDRLLTNSPEAVESRE